MLTMKICMLIASVAMVAGISGCANGTGGRGEADLNATSIYDFTMTDINGKAVSMADFKGKLLLIVNVASKCSFTPQYAGLQKLYDTYKDRGFVILAFPANNFLSQEPGTDGEIAGFCRLTYGVTFPVFSKISVKGGDMHPLYRYLTADTAGREFGGSIKWNFAKFLIAPDGRIVDRFAPITKPESGRIIKAIEAHMPR